MLTRENEQKWTEVVPGYFGRFVHGDGLTIAHWKIKAGHKLPAHRHPHEQIVNVLSGIFVMNVGDQVHELGAGDTLVIPSQKEHSAEAITDVSCLDVFTPVREDYRLS